jgi:pimeloyl-ACP methyl ester carboxylesterase
MATNLALLHGGGQGSWIWDELTKELTSSTAVDCIALDVPGCGVKRGRDTSTIEFDDIAIELIGDIQESGMRDVVLVGHSQAGMPIPRMVEFAPMLFSRLGYVACAAPPRGTSLLDLIGNRLRGERADQVGYPLDPRTTTLEERFAAMFCNDMTPVERDEFLAKLGHDNWPISSYTYSDWRYDHLDSVRSTYVLCEQDQSLPPSWQERFADTLRVDNVVRIDAGHQAMNTRPQALAAALLGALD